MADFPTTTHTFTPFSNGATSDAAQVTDIYSEVEAIEDGYLNATARLNSSNSTVANLSVVGGSTLAGTLAVTGASTFTGAATFAGAVTFSTPQPRVRVSLTADVNLPDNAFTGLNWTTDVYDASGMHSTSANSSRITFAHSTGVYTIGAQVDLNPNSSGFAAVRILINDSTVSVVAASGGNSPASVNFPLHVSADYAIASTADYATVQVFQNSGSTRSVSSTGIYAVAFWAHKVI